MSRWYFNNKFQIKWTFGFFDFFLFFWGSVLVSAYVFIRTWFWPICGRTLNTLWPWLHSPQKAMEHAASQSSSELNHHVCTHSHTHTHLCIGIHTYFYLNVKEKGHPKMKIINLHLYHMTFFPHRNLNSFMLFSVTIPPSPPVSC